MLKTDTTLAAEDDALRVLHTQLKDAGKVNGDPPTWQQLSKCCKDFPPNRKHLKTVQTRALKLSSEGTKGEDVGYRMTDNMAYVAIALHEERTISAKGKLPDEAIRKLTEEGTDITQLPDSLTMHFKTRGLWPCILCPSDAAELCKRPGAPKNPYAALLVWVSQQGVHRKDRNKRDDPILPGAVGHVSESAAKGYRNTFAPAAHMAAIGSYLSGLPPEQPDSKRPCLPLNLYNLGPGRADNRLQRRTPLPLLIFVDALMGVRQEDWRHGQIWTPRERLGDMVERLKGPAYRDAYRRSVNGQKWLDALHALHSPEALIPYREDGGWVGRFLVQVDGFPASGSLNDWMAIRVNLPSEFGSGPIVPRAALIRAANRSYPEFRLLLNVAFALHHVGRTRIPLRKNGPKPLPYGYVRSLPMSDDDCRIMTYPGGYSSTKDRSNQVRRAKKVLKRIIKEGVLRFTERKDGIMPGPNWPGYVQPKSTT